MIRKISLSLVAAILAACANEPRTAATMTAVATVDTLEAPVSAAPASAIGPLDILAVNVFRVADLTVDRIQVDASGSIEMPLIGTVAAAGKTPSELAEVIRERLAQSYLRNPQVTVRVIEPAISKVTVDGAVTEPGVYEMKGRTTLLQAVAMAKGSSRVSNNRSVAVFRTINDRRSVAVFDLAAIRAGQAVDPVLQNDDVVVVDTSRLSSAMRDVIAVLPSVGAFAYL
jgi:polysaccharide export outer membrane protein